jgi:hypothetical protein
MAKTEMVANKTTSKMVTIEAMMPVSVNNTILTKGQRTEVTEDEAKILCKKITTVYAFGGERLETDSPRHQIQRARIVE